MDTSAQNSGDRARVNRPERLQIEWRPLSLDQLLPADHRARLVWQYVCSLDLSRLYANIKSVEGQPGRDAVDPRILMTLWMMATIESISSARHLGRLCERDLVYQWICGGVGVNYHLLSDFHMAHGEFLDELLTQSVATLLQQGLVTLDVVAQDGMRVRASAGGSSFRREKTLKKCLAEAEEQVRKLRQESENESQQAAIDARCEAAQKRAVSERQERVQKALKELEQLQQQKEQRKKGTGKDARCSTTDPEARNMKMGDSGFRPAYNVQLATDGQARVIVGVDVTNSGSDGGQMSPMHEQIRKRYGQTPGKYLVDCGFASHEDISLVEQRGSQVFAPIHGEERMRKKGVDPYARQKKDTDESFAFRQRMATEEAKELYKKRPSIAEFPNAEFRNRGLSQFRVRGLDKVKTVSLWHAITFNFLRMIDLRCFESGS